MNIKEMKIKISCTEKLAIRGLLSYNEAEQQISMIIDKYLPVESVLDEESWRRMEQRRLAERRKWRFLLKITSDHTEVVL